MHVFFDLDGTQFDSTSVSGILGDAMSAERRRILMLATLALAVFGVALASMPFLRSLDPSARAIAKLPKIWVSDLKAGEYLTLDWNGFRHFVIRQSDESLNVFRIPYKEDTYYMPDTTWARAVVPCHDFHIPSKEEGVIDPDDFFKCVDTRLSEWWRKELVWDSKGKSQGNTLPDLPVPIYEDRGSHIVLGTRPNLSQTKN